MKPTFLERDTIAFSVYDPMEGEFGARRIFGNNDRRCPPLCIGKPIFTKSDRNEKGSSRRSLFITPGASPVGGNIFPPQFSQWFKQN